MIAGTELGAETLDEPVVVGLNWDFAPGMPKFDMDCSAACFGNTGSLVDAAFYNQLSACQGAVVHSGDCKDGRKEGMDETVTIDFKKLAGVTAIVFLISAFAGGTLKDCESAFCEIKQGSKVLATLNLAGPEVGDKSGVIMCMLYKHCDTMKWTFSKIGTAVNARHFAACVQPMRALVDTILDPGCLFERTLSEDKTFQMSKGDDLMLPADVMKVTVGLGWDTAPTSKTIDLDASCLFLADIDNDGDLDPTDGVYFGQKKKPGVESSGDNTTGAGSGDDEKLFVNLAEVPAEVTTLAFCVNIYTSDASFADVKNAYVRLYNTKTQHEYARFTLSREAMGNENALVFAFLVRENKSGVKDAWSILSVGEVCGGRTVKDIESPLWDGRWDGNTKYGEVPSYSHAQGSSSGGDDGCCALS